MYPEPPSSSTSGIPPTPPVRREGLATASLVLGILSFVLCLGCLSGVPAIICGHMAQSRITRSGGSLTGSGMCLAGLIMGYMSLLFTLIVIPLMSAIAVPNFIRARKRSQAVRTLEDLRLIDAAVEQYALSNNKAAGAQVTWDDIQPLLPAGSKLQQSNHLDIVGGDFGNTFKVDTLPSVPSSTFDMLSDMAPAEFWSPFPIGR